LDEGSSQHREYPDRFAEVAAHRRRADVKSAGQIAVGDPCSGEPRLTAPAAGAELAPVGCALVRVFCERGRCVTATVIPDGYDSTRSSCSGGLI
jgi:hypothetical protein